MNLNPRIPAALISKASSTFLCHAIILRAYVSEFPNFRELKHTKQTPPIYFQPLTTYNLACYLWLCNIRCPYAFECTPTLNPLLILISTHPSILFSLSSFHIFVSCSSLSNRKRILSLDVQLCPAPVKFRNCRRCST